MTCGLLRARGSLVGSSSSSAGCYVGAGACYWRRPFRAHGTVTAEPLVSINGGSQASLSLSALECAHDLAALHHLIDARNHRPIVVVARLLLLRGCRCLDAAHIGLADLLGDVGPEHGQQRRAC